MDHNTRAAIGGPGCWTGSDLERDRSWIWSLDGNEVAAIEAALAHATKAVPHWSALHADAFPLGAFGRRLTRLAVELEHGRGIVLLRGLPVESFDGDDLKWIHFGLAAHLGTPVFQSAQGELIGEITDEGEAALARGALENATGTGGKEVFLSSRARVQTTGPLRYHTDRADVVGLMCGRPAVTGGLSRIVSAVAIHDAMRARRPDLLEELYRPLPRSRLGEEAGGRDDYYMLPVFALEGDRFTSHYSRTYVEAGQKFAHVPRISERQWQALDLLQALGDELSLVHGFEPGDIQYLNNHVLYHARAAYEDTPGPGDKRLLYRVWIAMPNSRALPVGHGVLFGATEAGAVRGGIRQADGSNRPPNGV